MTGAPKIFVDGVGEVDLLTLPGAEEEGLIFADGAADLEAVLIELDQGFGAALSVGVKLLRVEFGIAEEFERGAVELVGAGAGGDGDVGAGVAAFLGGGVGGGDLELLHVIRVEAEDVVGGVGVGGFVGLNAVDGDVDGGGAGSVDVDGVAGALDDAGLIHEEVERVAAVEREGDDGLLLDDVAEGGVGGLEDFGGGADFNAVGDRADFENDVDGEGGVDLNGVAGADGGFEAGRFDADSVDADGNGGESVDAGVGGVLFLDDSCGVIGEGDGGVGDGGGGGIAHGAGELGTGGLSGGSEGGQGQGDGDGGGCERTGKRKIVAHGGGAPEMILADGTKDGLGIEIIAIQGMKSLAVGGGLGVNGIQTGIRRINRRFIGF